MFLFFRNPLKYFSVIESFQISDCSVVMKFSVHFNLFGVCILNLGTERHHYMYPLIDNGNIIGCFAMTELGHGSNVRCLETTSIFDKSTKQFIINSPTETSQKFWIGNSSYSANTAVVFANLIIDDINYGIHAFVVTIRDEKGNLINGIKIVDCGKKQGLNGVDNGMIQFNQIRIPQQNLLNRFADVTNDGEYITSIPNPIKRFSLHIGELSIARLVAATGANFIAMTAIAIAIYYCSQRKQFGPLSGSEQIILSYLNLQRRIFPKLAQLYATIIYMKSAKEFYVDRTKRATKDLHEIATIAKVVCTYTAQEITQTARECCGGQGYLFSNLICSLRNDIEAFVTVDGDNQVLLQQIAGICLDKLAKKFKSQGKFKFMISNIATQGTKLLSDYNPIQIFLSNDSQPFTIEFILQLLKIKKNQISLTLGQQLQKFKKQRLNSFDAWNKSGNQVVELGKIASNYAVYKQFVQSINQARGFDFYDCLNQLCLLYGLHLIENDCWFIVNNYISNVKHSIIVNQIDDLCNQIFPLAQTLVDTFKIPNYNLENTIAYGFNHFSKL
eukprot:TRINITY_DN1945_c0_g1_i1.p1 TRINITY_DN1945_c0_g1~~TRINITY_DN1945_c0_g1_i1.p1  ORF type:complete len:558 (+),score=225.00 TRINITY_DN1945_c0_g1_i1:390-2063(+)